MKIILISGKAESGKDTFARFFKLRAEHDNKKVLICHYADLLKFYAEKFYGWDGKKDKKGRELLQYLGTDSIREKDPNFWVNSLRDILSLVKDDFDFVCVADCRFPDELDRQAIFDGCVKVRVNRPNHENSLTEEQRKHLSETALDDYPFDEYVTNVGNPSFYDVVASIYEKVNHV